MNEADDDCTHSHLQHEKKNTQTHEDELASVLHPVVIFFHDIFYNIHACMFEK